ncbi:Gfo/Idh/MocA family oxidoreductase [Sphingobacterium chuzhouense]|uniref:Gfo/Idh/MocA family oxidoreductase n=1 Tax=Sphingobacterium chuzhouense TaxID=1742264 RepID=A0ABR7XUF7_9SPHI|nr:Gfo/Idh/MocA family oxidoreductase [Sphingobacterium chuzhouense]MBD1422681.1 Gfo/Idh/MocA family oxidoreductase [Sphingobacterium chuzhouense]
MEKQRINTGILSFGMSGRVFHAPFIYTNDNFDFTAVVERTKKTAKEIYPDVKSYDSVSDLLADDSIELVIVNTPNYTHFEFAKESLEAGKHILLEKPAVDNLDQLEKLSEISEKTGKKIFFYQNRRYDSHFMQVKEVIESGQLGKIIEAHIRFDRYNMELGPKEFKENSQYVSSGVAYDLGPHVLDQAFSVFGKPNNIIKTTAINRPGSQVPDFFNFHLLYPDNLQVFLTGNLLVADPQPAFVVHGSKGTFTKKMVDVQERQLIDGMLPNVPGYGVEPEGSEGKLVTVDGKGEKQTSLLTAQKGNYNLLFDAIYDSLRNQAAYPITIDQIKWQIEALQAPDFSL